MLRLPPFEYHAPKSIAEAVALKAEYGELAMYVAGGTDLFPNMKRQQFTPQNLIGLRKIPELFQLVFDQDGTGLTLGAGVSLNEVAEHPDILKNYPALAKAASLVSAPQLRNMGTIGGNLCLDTRCTYYNQSYQWRKALGFCLKKSGDTCWVARSSPKCLAVSSSDCAPVMVALEAEFCLASPAGEAVKTRIVPASEFYKNDGANFLNKTADELLVSIRLPTYYSGKSGIGWKMNYRKLSRRNAIDFPLLGVATAFRQKDNGDCAEARIVLGAVGSSPLRADEAEKILQDGSLTLERIEDAVQAAAKLAKPLDNTDMTLSYRKKMASRFITEAFNEVLKV
ncbi:MAG: FAD binding domain-containing protein [SAR324 cluster bacterium]|nr:FAD binding domain-containing protein [SAR324 cluster bacterium]MBL7034106.1 FAD binding domain-containing protein [SAR324 cluster bacterium]